MTLQEIVTLAGYATRVSDMLVVFGEVARGRCVRAVHVQAQHPAFQVTFRDNRPVPQGKRAGNVLQQLVPIVGPEQLPCRNPAILEQNILKTYSC